MSLNVSSKMQLPTWQPASCFPPCRSGLSDHCWIGILVSFHPAKPGKFPRNSKTKKPFMPLDNKKIKSQRQWKGGLYASKWKQKRQSNNEKSVIRPRAPPHRPVTFLMGKRLADGQTDPPPGIAGRWGCEDSEDTAEAHCWLSIRTNPAEKNLKISFIHAARSERRKPGSLFLSAEHILLPVVLRRGFLLPLTEGSCLRKGMHSSDGLSGMLRVPRWHPRWHPRDMELRAPLKLWAPSGSGLMIIFLSKRFSKVSPSWTG